MEGYHSDCERAVANLNGMNNGAGRSRPKERLTNSFLDLYHFLAILSINDQEKHRDGAHTNGR